MAVVLIEGWDHLSAAQVSLKGWTAVSSMTTGRFPASAGQASSQAARFTNSTSLRAKTLPSSYSTLFAGFAFRSSTTTGGATNTLFAMRALAVNALQLQLDALGRIVIKNSAGTTIATGTTVLAPAVWVYIEVKLVVNGASGTVEVHLNGATEIAQTTGNFGAANIDNIAITGLTGAAVNVDWDDIYCVDTTGAAPRNTFLGDVRVSTPMPTGAGAHSQWTANGASPNYACVNEVPADSDTTYVSSATPGQLDTYACGAVDGGATILGVQTNIFSEKDDANVRQLAPVIRQSGTDFAGTTFTQASTYQFYSQIWNQDPTGSDWTPAHFNGDEFGIDEIA